jgi:hypothetical protein
MKFPDTKIGEAETNATDWLSRKVEDLQIQPQPPETSSAPIEPPLPPRIDSLAGKVIELAEKHWPKPAEPRRHATPPPIRVKPGARK